MFHVEHDGARPELSHRKHSLRPKETVSLPGSPWNNSRQPGQEANANVPHGTFCPQTRYHSLMFHVKHLPSCNRLFYIFAVMLCLCLMFLVRKPKVCIAHIN